MFPSGGGDEILAAGVDSSCLNVSFPGSSYGGFHLYFTGSGAISARCLVPRKLAGSSLGSELIMSCLVSKAAIVARTQLEEVGMKQLGPTPTAMDANTVMQGAEMDRISKQYRWLAARTANLRQTIDDG